MGKLILVIIIGLSLFSCMVAPPVLSSWMLPKGDRVVIRDNRQKAHRLEKKKSLAREKRTALKNEYHFK